MRRIYMEKKRGLWRRRRATWVGGKGRWRIGKIWGDEYMGEDRFGRYLLFSYLEFDNKKAITDC